MSSVRASTPSQIKHKNCNFLITDNPSSENIPQFIQELRNKNVTDVVRACAERTYNGEELEKAGISVHEYNFSDGAPPPIEIIQQWMNLVNEKFPKKARAPPEHTIAVHCVAGLGRAPMLVAVALMERDPSLQPEEAVTLIRSKRRGAFNNRQQKFLQEYVPTSKGKGGCMVM